eukprot:365949-Chlamydomonas_euryale.AAC.20
MEPCKREPCERAPWTHGMEPCERAPCESAPWTHGLEPCERAPCESAPWTHGMEPCEREPCERAPDAARDASPPPHTWPSLIPIQRAIAYSAVRARASYGSTLAHGTRAPFPLPSRLDAVPRLSATPSPPPRRLPSCLDAARWLSATAPPPPRRLPAAAASVPEYSVSSASAPMAASAAATAAATDASSGTSSALAFLLAHMLIHASMTADADRRLSGDTRTFATSGSGSSCGSGCCGSGCCDSGIRASADESLRGASAALPFLSISAATGTGSAAPFELGPAKVAGSAATLELGPMTVTGSAHRSAPASPAPAAAAPASPAPALAVSPSAVLSPLPCSAAAPPSAGSPRSCHPAPLGDDGGEPLPGTSGCQEWSRTCSTRARGVSPVPGTCASSRSDSGVCTAASSGLRSLLPDSGPSSQARAPSLPQAGSQPRAAASNERRRSVAAAPGAPSRLARRTGVPGKFVQPAVPPAVLPVVLAVAPPVTCASPAGPAGCSGDGLRSN